MTLLTCSFIKGQVTMTIPRRPNYTPSKPKNVGWVLQSLSISSTNTGVKQPNPDRGSAMALAAGKVSIFRVLNQASLYHMENTKN